MLWCVQGVARGFPGAALPPSALNVQPSGRPRAPVAHVVHQLPTPSAAPRPQFACVNAILATTEPVDSARARFAANLHGSVTLEVSKWPRLRAARSAKLSGSVSAEQRGFDAHIRSLAANR